MSSSNYYGHNQLFDAAVRAALIEESDTAVPKLGSEKRPIIVRVHSDEKARYVAETCKKHGWHYIIGFEPDRPEDISDLEKMLNPLKPAMSNKIGRNEPCPCGSGKKFKRCCGA